MMSLMERVNLNLPSEARERMRELASEAGCTEGEYARELLLRALSQAELERVAEQVRRSRTPARKARDRAIAQGLEKLRG
jgi:predicted DNA-binding protein